MNYIINSLSLKKRCAKVAVNNQFRGINIKREPMNSDSWQNAYLFISQEKHTFMIINIVVRDLFWNGKAENTLSRVKTMSHMGKALGFTTGEKHSLPLWVPGCSEVQG